MDPEAFCAKQGERDRRMAEDYMAELRDFANNLAERGATHDLEIEV